MAQLNELKRMQQLAGLINESQLNEAESALQTYLTGIANNLNKKPEALAKEITDYLNSVLVRKDSKTTGEGTFYVVPSKKGAPFLMVMGHTDKSKGFVANEEISKWLAKADPYLTNETQDEIMKAYIQDTKLTTEKWGGFVKLPSTLHPNDLKIQQPQQESIDIESAVNEALSKLREEETQDKSGDLTPEQMAAAENIIGSLSEGDENLDDNAKFEKLKSKLDTLPKALLTGAFIALLMSMASCRGSKGMTNCDFIQKKMSGYGRLKQ